MTEKNGISKNEIIEAAKKQDINKIKSLYELGHDIFMQDKSEKNIFHYLQVEQIMDLVKFIAAPQDTDSSEDLDKLVTKRLNIRRAALDA